jgi:hypothetical protein
MATTIKLKNSVTTTSVPSSLVQGEVAINITDKKVWVGNAATTPIQLLGGGADGNFTNISVSSVATFGAGTVSAPSITTTGDTNTGIFFPAADTIAFTEGGVESMRIDSSGNVGIGTSSPSGKFNVGGGRSNFGANSETFSIGLAYTQARVNSGQTYYIGASDSATPDLILSNSAGTERMRITNAGDVGINTTTPNKNTLNKALTISSTIGYAGFEIAVADTITADFITNASNAFLTTRTAIPLVFQTNDAERMRITSGGDVLIGKTSLNSNAAGFEFRATNIGIFSRSGDAPLYVNRITNDGNLVLFGQDDTTEGTISVSGTTVSYNGGHLSRWSQLPSNQKDDTLLKGTVMSNLDDMCVWVKDGETLPNEQLNKMKVSDVEGDTNVAGVFVDWQFDEQCQSDDMNVAMTGDMIIRIAEGVVVQKGDLLVSAGDGTAKPQSDDIVRSKTIAKVTSNHVTCTYADGSYCVPCVLMAC